MSSHANGYRWSKFWWQDWQSDPALRKCSVGARGLWMELLCIMHQATPRGYLLISGQPPTAKELAALTCVPLKLLGVLLGELKAAGVYSHDLTGIYSRRMVKDSIASEKGRETGKRGGNPELLRRGNGVHPPQGVNPPDGVNPNPYPLPLNPNPYPKPLTGGVNLEADSEAEEERKPPVGPQQAGDAGGITPPNPDPPRRADGTNLRAVGKNPRALGTNPRSTAGNGHPKPKPFQNGFLTVIAREGMPSQGVPPDDDGLSDQTSYFTTPKAIRHGN